MKKSDIIDKIWNWAMNNTTVSACLFTLAIGLVIGGLCTLAEAIFC